MAKILEHNPFQDLLSKQGIAPLEAMAWTKQNAQSIRISLPKESDPNENRISLSPQAVTLLTNNGHEIVIEKGAGERAGFSDSDYLLAGASVSEDVAMIWQSALTLKITPPTIAEIARMKEGQAFISSASYQHLSSELIDAINAKKLMAIGLEFVEDNGGGFPFIKIMAEIAGQLILPIATDLIQKKKGLLLGNVTGVPPCNMVILGAGQVVEQVARAAASAGVQFQVFDKDIYKFISIENCIKTRKSFGGTSFDNVKKDLGEVREKSAFILGNVHAAKEYVKATEDLAKKAQKKETCMPHKKSLIEEILVFPIKEQRTSK